MSRVVECILNISEGIDQRVIQAIGDSIETVEGARLLNVASDATHHRTVFTFAALVSLIGDCAFEAVATACGLIDMRKHRGVHPRIGAADVVPFVPVGNSSMQTCIQIARKLGVRVGEQLQVPVYYYGEASITPKYRDLAELRRGQFEGLPARMATEGWSPDVGPSKPHPSAGAMAIGARSRLIAFNVYLSTRDLSIAQNISSQIRARNGGLTGVKALGLFIEHRNQAQVSMNLTDPDTTSMRVVYERVKYLSESLGVKVDCSELIGLVSEKDLTNVDAAQMKIIDFDERRFLEKRLEEND
jgi:glutamate formiminotransferase